MTKSKTDRAPTLADFERALGVGDGDMGEHVESRRIIADNGHDPNDRAALDKAYKDALWSCIG